MKSKKMTVWLLLTLVSTTGLMAADANNSLEISRKNYQAAARAIEDLPHSPKLGTPTFQADLTVWSELQTQYKAAVSAHVAELFAAWNDAENSTEARSSLETELSQLRRKETAKPTAYGMQQQQSFANHARKHLIDASVTPAEANFLARMSKPGAHQRQTDKMAAAGRASEPYGWDVQDTYSLALMRCGEYDKARAENQRLLRKVDLLIRGREPYYRQFYLQRSLIEAHAGELKAASEYLDKAPGDLTAPPIPPDAAVLYAELKSIIEKGQQP